jgi:hypothetical protein
MNTIYDTIIKNQPVIFAKFGDGEYLCASGNSGANCDGDSYNKLLSQSLKEAVIYFSKLDNAYLGAWHSGNVPTFFNTLTPNCIKWVNYHTFIMDNTSFNDDTKLQIYSAIKNNPRRKIVVANELLARAKILLNAEHHVIVPFRNWFEPDFNNILTAVLENIGDDDEPLILTSAGMGAKVLIMELHKRKPHGIFIDIGSGLDFLCTKKDSRGCTFSYETLENYFRPILPENWNDSSYNYIFDMSKSQLGLHLH